MESIKQQFVDAYDEYSDAIFRFCYSKTSHRDQALDLMQETFTKAWKYILAGNEIENIRALLYTTARNLIIDYYRKKKEVSLDMLLDEGFAVVSEAHIGIEDASDAKIAIALIHKLDDAHRDVLLLRFVEGLGPKEIAVILNENENAISVRINRAIKKVKELVKSND